MPGIGIVNVDIRIDIAEALRALGRILKDWRKSTIRDEEYNRELISLCRSQDLQGVKALLRERLDVSARDENGRTLLIIASTIGDRDSVGEENFQLVKLLLACELRPEVDARDNKGNTALIMASRNGAKRIVQALIDAGADVNAKNERGWTGLMRAAKHGYIETVKLLMENGADKDLENMDGRKAVDIVKGQIEATERHVGVLKDLKQILS